MKKRYYFYEWDILKVQCSHCLKIKPSTEFDKHKGKWYLQLASRCKECSRIKKAEDYIKNHEKNLERWKKYYQKNKEIIDKKHKEAAKLHPERAQNTYNRRKGKIMTQHEEHKKELSKQLGFNWQQFHIKAWKYAKKYNLYPEYCPFCWSKWKIEFHHPSYETFEKWKEWVFACTSCHKKLHSWELQYEELIDLIQLNSRIPIILTDKDLDLFNNLISYEETGQSDSWDTTEVSEWI